MSNAIPQFSSLNHVFSADPAQKKISLAAVGTSSNQLMSKAKEFESILLGQWLQAAESSFGNVPGDEEEDAGDEQMKSFGVQQLAKGLSDSGGIGIAAIVSKALAKSTAGKDTS